MTSAEAWGMKMLVSVKAYVARANAPIEGASPPN
jgi:hypothetical protein